MIDPTARPAQQCVDFMFVEFTADRSDQFCDFHNHHHIDLIFLIAWETFARALCSEQSIAAAIAAKSRPAKQRRSQRFRVVWAAVKRYHFTYAQP
jgi:hypothetical protein